MSRTPQEQANLDFVLEMYNEVLIARDSSKVDKYLTDRYVQHSSLAEPGLQALKDFLDMVKKRSPEAKTVIHRAMADGDQVALHVQVIRHPGDPGIAVVDWYRLEDGEIVEHWDVVQPVPEKPVNPLPMF
jgi:predicted SnoaL-like aldol condensation-catalyzing enzyme